MEDFQQASGVICFANDAATLAIGRLKRERKRPNLERTDTLAAHDAYYMMGIGVKAGAKKLLPTKNNRPDREPDRV